VHKPFHQLLRHALWASLQSASPSRRIVMEEEEGRERQGHRPPDYVVDVSIVDDAVIHMMNRRHRGRDMPTNVLSFWDEQACDAWHSMSWTSHGMSRGTSRGLSRGMSRGMSQDGRHRPSMAPWCLGDIILGYQTVMKESRALSMTWYRHACRLIIHGGLHLVGYTHGTEGAYRLMEQKADKAWALTRAAMRDYDESMAG